MAYVFVRITPSRSGWLSIRSSWFVRACSSRAQSRWAPKPCH